MTDDEKKQWCKVGHEGMTVEERLAMLEEELKKHHEMITILGNQVLAGPPAF